MGRPSINNQLIVFGRYPVPGLTKTRLIPILGSAGAASLQRTLTERTVATARKAARQTGARLVFCHDGGSEKQMQRWLGDDGIIFTPQVSGDLGRRMHLAMKTAFDHGARRVVLVGTDIPGLTIDILEQAFGVLNEKDLVLGPSTDGGYWLVGMARFENIFNGIAWSTADVLQQTLALARQMRMNTHLLQPLNDLDTPDDLAREMGGNQLPLPSFPVKKTRS